MEKPGIQEKCVNEVCFQLISMLVVGYVSFERISTGSQWFHGMTAHQPMERSLTRITGSEQITLLGTNSSPLKRWHPFKGKDRLPIPIFRRYVSFGEGNFQMWASLDAYIKFQCWWLLLVKNWVRHFETRLCEWGLFNNMSLQDGKFRKLLKKDPKEVCFKGFYMTRMYNCACLQL